VRADTLVNKLLKRDDISFWKDVSKTNRINSNVLASTISGVSGECILIYSTLMVIQSICQMLIVSLNVLIILLDRFLSLVFQKSETQLQISNLTKVLVQTLCKVNTLSLLILDYSVYSVYFLVQFFLMDIYPLC